MNESKIDVYLVDDHELVVEGISAVLKSENKFNFSGYSLSGTSCLDYFKDNNCDVLLLDIGLPDISGIEVCRMLKANKPELKILALSSYTQGSFIKAMKEIGADGYLFKNASKTQIIEAIHIVYFGGEYFTKEAEIALQNEINQQHRLPKLTRREQEVLENISKGLTNSQIAEKLFISIDTVDSHRKHLYSKLNVNNSAMLVRYALEHNLI